MNIIRLVGTPAYAIHMHMDYRKRDERAFINSHREIMITADINPDCRFQYAYTSLYRAFDVIGWSRRSL